MSRNPLTKEGWMGRVDDIIQDHLEKNKEVPDHVWDARDEAYKDWQEEEDSKVAK